MRFIDLFAGLGGFHLALSRLGHECVFACEIDEELRDLYGRNFGISAGGDIRKIHAQKIPRHDVLCAGFPCQPFSKAGDQKGFDCPKWGNLFNHVARIVKFRRPPYLILENVPNLARHDKGSTWEKMRRRLERLGYAVDIKKLSPHKFGIPQIRERVFIVGSLRGLSHFRWPEEHTDTRVSITTVLDSKPKEARPIPDHVVRCLSVWQNFIQRFPKSEELPSFPIWSMEFGATYPYENETPYAYGVKALAKFRGNHGISLGHVPAAERFQALPSYARSRTKRFPDWKIRFIRLNRELYRRHQEWIDPWMQSILSFPQSRQKLEWNCKGEKRDIWSYLIQLRASGVRVKRPTTAPAIVAMTLTQVPIIGWERRYMTPRECARLQSLNGLHFLPTSISGVYESLGNAVNANVVRMIAESLLDQKKGLAACSVTTSRSLALAVASV